MYVGAAVSLKGIVLKNFSCVDIRTVRVSLDCVV